MWDFLGGALGGLLGYKGAKDQQVASAQQAEKQMAFQERMSSTAHQRQMADMRKAGLNPILSAKYGGASTPAGQQAPVPNRMERALNSAQQLANLQLTIANTELTDNKKSAMDLLSAVGQFFGRGFNTAMSVSEREGRKIRSGAKDDLSSIKDWVTAVLPNTGQTSEAVSINSAGNLITRPPPKATRKRKIKYPEKYQRYQYQKWRN